MATCRDQRKRLVPLERESNKKVIPEATGQVISYVRDPKKFKVNQYVQYIQSPAPYGLYMELDRDQPARVVTDAEYAWEDGDPRPEGKHNQGNFRWMEFKTYRRDYPFMLGQQAVDTAKGWKPLAFHAGIVAQQAMTNRTQRIITLAETTSNWGANYATANSLNAGAGFWSQASNDETSPNYLAIQKTINACAKAITLSSNAIIDYTDLILVVSPGLALAMANTAEIHDYLARSQFALGQVRGDVPGQNAEWGLPDRLYGMSVIVENAVRVAERPNITATAATTNRVFCKSDNSAFIVSRPGGIDGNYGSPSYSTIQCYFYEYELTVESFDDSKNKRTEGHIVEQFKEVLAAAPTGYLITNTLS